MFGKGKKEDSKIAQIKMGSLNMFYVDRISQKRSESNKKSAKEDITVPVISDASEEEFRNIFDEFIAENGDYDRVKFPLFVIENGYYCIVLNQQLMVPGQKW